MRSLAVAALAVMLAVGACSNSYSATDTPDASTTPDSTTCNNSCPDNSCGLMQLPCGQADCGACANAIHSCVDNACKCVPKSCQDLGAQCGAISDGCGGEVFCGACAGTTDAGATDAAAGDGGTTALTCNASNMCSTAPCVPKTAAEACFSSTARLCGKHPDGCGGLADCGLSACSGVGETCGGASKPGECGCTPQRGCTGPCYNACADGCGGNTKKCGCSNCH